MKKKCIWGGVIIRACFTNWIYWMKVLFPVSFPPVWWTLIVSGLRFFWKSLGVRRSGSISVSLTNSYVPLCARKQTAGLGFLFCKIRPRELSIPEVLRTPEMVRLQLWVCVVKQSNYSCVHVCGKPNVQQHAITLRTLLILNNHWKFK